MRNKEFIRITVRPDVYHQLVVFKKWLNYKENSEVLRDAFKAYRLVYMGCGGNFECVKKVVNHVNEVVD